MIFVGLLRILWMEFEMLGEEYSCDIGYFYRYIWMVVFCCLNCVYGKCVNGICYVLVSYLYIVLFFCLM